MHSLSRAIVWAIVLCGGLIVALAACRTAPYALYTNPLRSPIDREIHRVVGQHSGRIRAPGLAIGVLTGGERVVYGYGETVRGNRSVPNRHTIFEIGSISKTFTATLWADHALTTGLDLDTPLSDLTAWPIDTLERDGVAVTVRHLLNHTSGLPRIPEDLEIGMDPQRPYRHYGEARLLQYLSQVELAAVPGTVEQYSNIGFGTAGVALEHRTGARYEQLVRDRIVEPLALNDTGVEPSDEQLSRFAQGHTRGGDPTPRWGDSMGAIAGAGALYSTVDDLLIYAEAQLGDTATPIDAAIALTQQITYRAADESVATGLGWYRMRLSPDRPPVYLHDGGTGGFSSFIAFSHSERLAVVLLANGGDALQNSELFFVLVDTLQALGAR